MLNLFIVVGLLLIGCATPVVQANIQDSTTQTVETLGFLESEECSYSIEDNACDFQLLDQNGQPWRLENHLGDVVLIDLSVMWCGPCQYAATTAQSTEDVYSHLGFHYVTILMDNFTGSAAVESDCLSWATNFGITDAPVLVGDRDMLTSGGAVHGFPVSSWPTFIILNRNHEIVWAMDGYSESALKAAIEQYL